MDKYAIVSHFKIMLIKETERTKCSLSESLTSNAIAQLDATGSTVTL